ncbi:hypothetical protein LTR12_010042 [Friedmanniomyces endolithicus]|nr:hypothetical protein LTR12_010042 [Friedmanniomyces endolithicus]
MRHKHGFSVALRHADGRYAEHRVPADEARCTSKHPHNTRWDGKYTSAISQVAIVRLLEPTQAESFSFRLALTGNFEWYSATALRVVIRIGLHGQENREDTFTVLKRASVTRLGTSKARTLVRTPIVCGSLPPPLADGAELSRTWNTKRVANPGTVAVFVTRGHNLQVTASRGSDSGPQESQQTHTPNFVAAPWVFKPVQSRNGATYCFEFQEPLETKSAEGDTACPCEHRSSKDFEPGFMNEPSHPLVEEARAHTEHGPPEDIRPAKSVTGYVEASDAQDAGTAGQSLETDDPRPAIVQEDVQTLLAPPAAIGLPQQSQQAPLPALAINEAPVVHKSPAPQHSQPPTQRHFDIDMTLDNEELVVVKQEAEVPSARKRRLVTVDEDEEDEDELRDQMMEVELGKKEIELRRKMRGLKKKKQRVVTKREG